MDKYRLTLYFGAEAPLSAGQIHDIAMTTNSLISHYVAPEPDSDQGSSDDEFAETDELKIITEHQWSQLPGTSVFQLELTYWAEEDIDTVPYAMEQLRDEIVRCADVPQLTFEDATALYHQQYSAYLDNDARAKRVTKMHADIDRLNAPADTNKLNTEKKRRQERKKKKRLACKAPRPELPLSAHRLTFAKAKFQELLSFIGLTDLAEFIQVCETYDKHAPLIEMKPRVTEASVEKVVSDLASYALESAKALKAHAIKQDINPTELPALPEEIKSQARLDQISAWKENIEKDRASYNAMDYYLNTRTPRMFINQVIDCIYLHHAVLSLIKQILQIEKPVNQMKRLIKRREEALTTLKQKFYPRLFKANPPSEIEDPENIWAERSSTPVSVASTAAESIDDNPQSPVHSG